MWLIQVSSLIHILIRSFPQLNQNLLRKYTPRAYELNSKEKVPSPKKKTFWNIHDNTQRWFTPLYFGTVYTRSKNSKQLEQLNYCKKSFEIHHKSVSTNRRFTRCCFSQVFERQEISYIGNPGCLFETYPKLESPVWSADVHTSTQDRERESEDDKEITRSSKMRWWWLMEFKSAFDLSPL